MKKCLILSVTRHEEAFFRTTRNDIVQIVWRRFAGSLTTFCGEFDDVKVFVRRCVDDINI